MTYSIVTGHGFTGNAQRFDDEFQGYPLYNYGIYNSGFTFGNYKYNISFKYRSNCSIYLSDQYTTNLSFGTFPVNTGNAKQVMATNYNGSTFYGACLGFTTDVTNTMQSNSSSNFTIPTVPGTVVNFTTATGLEISSGITLFVQSYPNGYWFNCIVTSYNINTGQVVANSINNNGTGTYSSWYIYYAGGAWFEIDEVNLFRVT